VIRITVELLPHGDESRRRVLATGEMWNDGRGAPRLGSYGFRLLDKDGTVFQNGYLGEFDRQNFSVWWLLAACFKVALSDPERAFKGGRIVSKISDRASIEDND